MTIAKTPAKFGYNTNENMVHIPFVKYVGYMYPELVVAHVPNEGKRSVFIGKLMKSMGLLAGYPDLIIHLWFGATMVFEIKCLDKKGKKTSTSEAQNACHTKLLNLNSNLFICYTLDECIYYFENFIKNKFPEKSKVKSIIKPVSCSV